MLFNTVVAYAPLQPAPTIEEMIASYDWDYETAYAVMMCESGGDPSAVNDNPVTKDMSVGLYQVNLFGDNALTRPSEEWLKNPANNIYYAHELYKSGGWYTHWRNCL